LTGWGQLGLLVAGVASALIGLLSVAVSIKIGIGSQVHP
jgi:hypothetical protein